MAATDMARWSCVWRNPYTEPPDGKPRTLKAVLVPRGERCPQEIIDLCLPYGSGWCPAWELVTQRPIRRWSAEQKAAARRRNLRRRLEAKVPLFADMFEAAELNARPGYFAGEDVRPL